LNWASSLNATGYNVKRSTTNAGSYSFVASIASQIFTNTGLSNGTLYYFVVSSTNAAGESANSLPVSARAIASSAPQLSSSVSAAQLQLAWPQDHTGWILLAQTNSAGDGLGTNWVPVATSTNTNQLAIPVDSNQGSVFFRLVSP
jgi:cellulose 1,4-beta-cellobiosidase